MEKMILTLKEAEEMMRRSNNSYLDLGYTHYTEIEEGIKIDNYLCVDESSDLKKLPEDIEVFGCAYLSGSPIEDLGGLRYIPGSLTLSSSAIKTLPKDLYVLDNLDISNTAITTLPEGLYVGGCLDVSNTNINLRDIPKGVKIEGEITCTLNNLK